MSTGQNPAPSKTTPPRISPKRAAQIKRQQARRRNQILIWSIVAVAVIALLVVLLSSIFLNPNTPGGAASKSAIEGVASFTGLERNHKAGTLPYPQSPPVGGNHAPAWQNCGVYDAPVVKENAVHSMEHGAVWITYQPNLPANTVEQLRSQAVGGRGYVLLTPYADLTSPVVATAWGYQLKLDDATDPRLAQFIATYAQGPQTPEPGAVCAGAVGNPIQK